ncbi:MAG: 50S ribosomal protein L25 [SAR86 cluster bacterium]|nr:50S ribosomal protein L25 [SAR86 cluster bacterium]MDA0899898.1 50S ribosomal protein L25 [Pseudomonadota bacterium]MDA1056766.1 50S ribosomal protein L25 [Pseudomonadota bacterium]
MINLKVEKRNAVGGLSAKKAIADKNVPGIVYGGGKDPQPIMVQNNELIKIVSNESVFNTLVELEIGSDKETVVIKEIQKHPSKNLFTHIDLQRIAEGSRVNVVVPVVLMNQEKCFGVKIEGGVINHVLKEVDVLADPNNIPESIEVDMEKIKSKEKVRLSSLPANESYDFSGTLKNQDPVLVSVLTARGGSLGLEGEDSEDDSEDSSGESTTDNEASEENSSDSAQEKSE